MLPSSLHHAPFPTSGWWPHDPCQWRAPPARRAREQSRLSRHGVRKHRIICRATRGRGVVVLAADLRKARSQSTSERVELGSAIAGDDLPIWILFPAVGFLFQILRRYFEHRYSIP
ncbi:hypothetical protein MRX96_046136 [Rhipicephalus microplus]